MKRLLIGITLCIFISETKAQSVLGRSDLQLNTITTAAPFCILDEVDAPLDDANIDRYLQLIRKFSENTQFLMITHNKKTMEAADTLYGVTMEEVGVSKMVSVQLRDGKETRKEVTADVDEEVVMQDNE